MSATCFCCWGFPIYGLLTFKKVFGFSWFSTVIRSAVVVFAYSVILLKDDIGPLFWKLDSLRQNRHNLSLSPLPNLSNSARCGCVFACPVRMSYFQTAMTVPQKSSNVEVEWITDT